MNTRLAAKKFKIILKDSRFALAFLGFWLFGGFLLNILVLHTGLCKAIGGAFFLCKIDHDLARVYEFWSQGVIFGVVFSILFSKVIERYNPERGCRMIAQDMKDHLVIVGFSHLGQRLVEHVRERKIPYCLIEKDKAKVDELLRLGEPVIVDDAKGMDALNDASVARAKAVIVVSNNLETALIVTKRARGINPQCPIVTRCFQDELAEIIESLGANEVISSSKDAFISLVNCLKI